MKILLYTVSVLLLASAALGAPFKPLPPGEAYGVASSVWRFASNLSQDTNGVIELCYAERGNAERVIGQVPVRPFRSSSSKMPELRILFSKALVDGQKKVILIVGYGLENGTFVVDIPDLTSHPLAVSGTPRSDSAGEYTLLGWGTKPITLTRDGVVSGAQGRLYFRFKQM